MKQPDYQSEPTDLDRLLNLISFTAMAALLIYSAWIYPQLPDRIPTHFNIRGEPDDYGPKTIFLLFPGIAFALFVLFSVISRKPQNYNYPFKITPENADRQYRLANALMTTIKTTVILLMGYLAYGTAQVAHVSVADPVSPLLADACFEAAKAERIDVSKGGIYLVMEGPQFSTRAESNLYRSWGCDVIGMTNMPEAKLAREAEICYATVAMVTDYDCWHEDHLEVDVSSIIEVMKGNTEKAQRLVLNLARNFPREHPACPIGSDRALDVAIITRQEHYDRDLMVKLDAVAGRVLQRS